jgi:hypothetical protein
MAELILPPDRPQRQKHINHATTFRNLLELSMNLLAATMAGRRATLSTCLSTRGACLVNATTRVWSTFLSVLESAVRRKQSCTRLWPLAPHSIMWKVVGTTWSFVSYIEQYNWLCEHTFRELDTIKVLSGALLRATNER